MTTEQAIRHALHVRAQRHLVDPSLPSSTVVKARLSRIAHTIAAGVVVTATVAAAIATVGNLDSSTADVGAAAGTQTESRVASGTAPNGSKWRLYSYVDRSGMHCFGLSAEDRDGESWSCHAVPPALASWLQIEAARFTTPKHADAGGALYGEVAGGVAEVTITLDSGEVVAPDLVRPTHRPYAYFFAFLPPQVFGTIEVYNREGDVVAVRDFRLKKGMLAGLNE